MALVLKDRVRENTTTTGTGSVVLAGTSSGYQNFSVIGDANTTYYTIANPIANEWEVGIGTYTLSTTSLSRDTVLASSGLSSAVAISSISQSTTTVTVNTAVAHGITAGQVITVNAIANATSLVSGTTATILTVGTTDFTLIGASSNTVGVSFTTNATVPLGTGTVTLNAQGTGKTVLTASGSTLTYAGTTATYSAITLLTGSAGVLTPFTAGSKDVFVTYPAGRSVYADSSSIVASNAALTPVSSGGTGVATLAVNSIPYGNGTSPYQSSANLVYDGTTLRVGTAALLAGTTNPVVAATGNFNNYMESYVYNSNSGSTASADFVAYANNSTDAAGWANLGYNSSTFNEATYSVTGPNEAYLLCSALNSSFTGNIVYATSSTGSANAHQWYVGGFNQVKGAYKMQLNATTLTTSVPIVATSITPIAGTTTVAPIVLTSGTNLTTAAAGAIEYDGENMYGTVDTTSGRSSIGLYNQFKLTADGSNINTIANFFGATSNISLVAQGYYDIEIILYFRKNTAGTVTWTLTNSAAPTEQNVYFEMSPVTGIVAPPGTATMLVGQAINATATYAFTTASLTAGADHYARFRIQLDNGNGTSLKIQATAGSGTLTPLAGSIWTARRLNATNNGTYAA